jgi:hypothetical protein
MKYRNADCVQFRDVTRDAAWRHSVHWASVKVFNLEVYDEPPVATQYRTGVDAVTFTVREVLEGSRILDLYDFNLLHLIAPRPVMADSEVCL